MAAGWMSIPNPPDLDGERLFKLSLSTLLLGEVERAGGDAAAWESAVRERVPYHPAGRNPEDKIARPESVPSGDARDGEIALLEHLRKLEGAEERLNFLYREAEAGLEALLVDPVELGEAWDPARWIGPEATWDALAAWSGPEDAFARALSRQLGVTWIAVGAEGQLAQALSDELSAVSCPASDLVETVEKNTATSGSRVVLIAVGDAGLDVLDGMRDHAGLRDRVLALVAVGVPIWGRPGAEGPLSEGARRDWMDANFRHESLDTEAQRLTPYCAIQWLDWSGLSPDGLGFGHARFGAPGGLAEAPRIDSVDLGPVPVDIDRTLLVRALAATVGVLVLCKR